jgi:hypothetical protein
MLGEGGDFSNIERPTPFNRGKKSQTAAGIEPTECIKKTGKCVDGVSFSHKFVTVHTVRLCHLPRFRRCTVKERAYRDSYSNSAKAPIEERSIIIDSHNPANISKYKRSIR